jgi:uncharacterized protein YbcI
MDSLYLARGHLLRGSEVGSGMAPVEQQQVDGPLLASISRAVVRIVHEYTGRGPTKARTSIRDDIVVVMLQETLLKAEQSLIRDEKDRVVVEIRRTFQQTMREDLSAAVEMLTERKVIAFMSDSHLDPDYSVELFVLAPLEET